LRLRVPDHLVRVDHRGLVRVADAVVDDRDTVILFTNAHGQLVGLDDAWTTDQPATEFLPPSQLGAS